MAKWSGRIGFVVESEDDYGVVTTNDVERYYVGDLLKNYRRFNDGISINERVSIGNTISVISDPYLADNLQNIRYIFYMGVKWKVESVEIQYPRIILTLGGEYSNG